MKRLRRVFRGVTREPAFLAAMLVSKGVEFDFLEFEEKRVDDVPVTYYRLKPEDEYQMHDVGDQVGEDNTGGQ